MTNPNSLEYTIQKINLKTCNNNSKAIWLAKKSYYGAIFFKFKDEIRRT